MTHRFFVGAEHGLQNYGDERAWVQNPNMRQQWLRVLKFRVGETVSLFDENSEFLYKIAEIKDNEIALEKVTEVERQLPKQPVMLAWSILKRDKNDWILQKATEIGVTHLVPVLAARSEKTDLDLDRSKRIVIEAAEQCGRADIPQFDEIQPLKTVITEYRKHYDLYIAHMGGQSAPKPSAQPYGGLVGPEGGWSQEELELFEHEQLSTLSIGLFVLRAETAAIILTDRLVMGSTV